MGEDLFEGLPPPSHSLREQPHGEEIGKKEEEEETPPPPPRPALKSALKRPKPAEPDNPPPTQELPPENSAGSGKKLKFKTTTDASEQQVIEAMQKISSHIKNLSKFSKASKLAIQLVQAGSVKLGISDHFFAILEAAMSNPTSCNNASVRSDYHSLFSAAQDAAECFDNRQKLHLDVWTTRAVIANDLFTDDSFVFSKTAKTVRDTISNLPFATEDDDTEEAAALKDEKATTPEDGEKKQDEALDGGHQAESDPFGLDALIPSNVKKEEKSKSKKDAASKTRMEEEETRRFLASKREALISCLEIAARRYKNPWCQTVIDILVKHAYDNVARFTSKQREAIGKLWASIREQQARRKQGKSVNGKLDVTAFEWLQEKYSTEKISIRRAVGGSGDRRAQQWLG